MSPAGGISAAPTVTAGRREWEAAITLCEIQPLVDDGKMVPLDSYPDGEHETACTVADLPTFRLLFLLSVVFASMGVTVYRYDVSQAFIHALLEVFWQAFSSAFKAKNVGRMSSVLQLTVDYDTRGVYLSQSRQIIKELITKFKLPQKTYNSPMDRVAQYLHHTQHYRIIYEHIRVPLSVLTVQVYSDADHARDRVNDCLSYTGGVIFVNGLLLHWACTRQTDADMSSTGSEYVAASVTGQRSMSVLHMLVEMFGSIRIAQQEPVSACATATSYPTSDSDWMQRAARFFEDHALGVGQHGPPSPPVPVYLDATRSRMYEGTAPFIPRVELPACVMIDNTACSSTIGNAMLSPKVKHVVDKVQQIISMISDYMSDIIRPHPSGVGNA
ncbi:hypothetical protein CYMTET_27835 [Cymbomonas tetramitiformis]|uniref:Uncharacterized protein n=1 Tax=Cymbomonas tetramitiformis TaxID=36881 RepID=A0AAE0FNZ8_9CHLO|nr:hypothetical protein CYMTET_27835 [Cymbomonas tetramitiformis]